MSPISQSPQWSIPGIGLLQPCYDQVRFVSSAKVGALKRLLPTKYLKRAFHKFDILTSKSDDPGLKSDIPITGTNDFTAWRLLASHEHMLGQYRAVQVEIAFDVAAKSESDAHEKLFALVGLLTKPRHFRKYLLLAHKPDQNPLPGHMAEPTFYFEDRRSSVALKCYCRYLKLKGGSFGGPCVRLEWKLKGRAAIERHLGGNKIKDLLKADLNRFLEVNLRLEKVDQTALEKLIGGLRLGGQSPSVATPIKVQNIIKQFKDPAYRSKRTVHLMLRALASREVNRIDDWQQALWVCENSPAQIRGYLRRLQKIELLRAKRSSLTSREKQGLRKPGRPKQLTRRRAMSDHRINKCFKRIQLQPV